MIVGVHDVQISLTNMQIARHVLCMYCSSGPYVGNIVTMYCSLYCIVIIVFTIESIRILYICCNCFSFYAVAQ